MIKLSKLFQDINNFYRKAIQDYSIVKYSQMQSYVSPDTDEDEGRPDAPDGGNNNELYGDLTKAAREVSDPSLGSELLLIAEMYRKVLQLGKGYSSINRAISNIMNNYLEDEDSPEQSSVEDLLNEVVRDLRVRAGGQANLNKPDSPEVIAELKKFKDEFNNRAVQDEIEDLSQFDDKAVSTFDPTGGMGQEEAQKGSGRGYFVKKVKSLKDWVEYYSNEKNRYENDFSQPNNKLLKTKIDNIINVLTELINSIITANKLQQEIAASPDPNKETQLQELQQKIRELRAKRSQIRGSLRRDLLDLQKNSLQSELTNTRDNRERFLLQQKIDLNNILLSQDRNKGEEVRLRKILIKSMSDGNSLGRETLEKLLAKIQEAAAQKTPIEDIRKQQAADIGNEKRSGKLRGLVIFYGQNINTQKREIKIRLYPEIKKKLAAEESSTYKPYIDAIDAAANAAIVAAKAETDESKKTAVKNDPRCKQLTKELNSFLSQRANSFKIVTDYDLMAKKLQDYEKILFTISEPGKNVDSTTIKWLIDYGKKLDKEINNIENIQFKKFFNPITKNIKEIIKFLEQGNIQ